MKVQFISAGIVATSVWYADLHVHVGKTLSKQLGSLSSTKGGAKSASTKSKPAAAKAKPAATEANPAATDGAKPAATDGAKPAAAEAKPATKDGVKPDPNAKPASTQVMWPDGSMHDAEEMEGGEEGEEGENDPDSDDVPWSGPPKMFSAEDLKGHDGTVEGKAMLLVILGEVYDVSSNRKLYKKGEDYNSFLGKDASRAFHDGEFEEKEAKGDVADCRTLNDIALLDVTGWRQFYRKHKTYTAAGKLIGLYYDGIGFPTPVLREVEAKHLKGKAISYNEAQQIGMYYNCNLKYEKALGKTIVKCPPDDEGRQGEQGKATFPRKLKWNHPGTGNDAERCACFTYASIQEGLTWGTISQWKTCPEHMPTCVTG